MVGLRNKSNKNMGGLATRRRRRTWIGLTVGLAAVVALAVAALLTVKPWTPEFRHGGLVIAAAPAPVRAFSKLTPPPANAPAPSAHGLAAELGPLVTSPDLGGFSGSVTDAATGTVLWSSDPDKPVIPASTNKVLTAAAALLAVPSDHRVPTTVVSGSTPGELVLVAGGDPTLTAAKDGKGYYPGAAKLSDLVNQIKQSGRQIDSIAVDTSVYAGPGWPVGWDPADIAGGSWAPIEPVMLEGGRLDPTAEYSPRSGTPALDVGRALATALGVDPAAVHAGKAPAGATEVARVESAPLRDRLRQMMVDSDDVLAEAIGREIAAATGGEQSFGGAAGATLTTLGAAGFDTAGVTLLDNSGLSTEDRVPARLLDKVLTEAAAPQPAAAPPSAAPNPMPGAPTSAAPTTTTAASAQPLTPLLDLLPVAGGTGSLAPRFTDGTPTHGGAGWVRAKTGTLSVSSALAGYVLDNDGRVLTFALMSNDRPPEASRPALDAIAAALRNCGCS